MTDEIITTIGRRLRVKSLGDYLGLFDESVRARIVETLDRDDVLGAVCFENLQMDSSNFGARTSMIYGPGCTYRTLEDATKGHLHDLPSQRQYPTYVYTKDLATEQALRGFGARGGL